MKDFLESKDHHLEVSGTNWENEAVLLPKRVLKDQFDIHRLLTNVVDRLADYDSNISIAGGSEGIVERQIETIWAGYAVRLRNLVVPVESWVGSINSPVCGYAVREDFAP